MEQHSRKKGWEIEAEKRRTATECKKGHPYTEENTLWKTRKGKTSRNCRECIKLRADANKVTPRQEPWKVE